MNSEEDGDSPLAVDALSSQQTISPENSKEQAIVGFNTQEITNRTLQFISNASNETLGACFVGLGACTYFVLGRVGLVLIGAVGGIVLHATWEINSESTSGDEASTKESKRRREVGLDVVNRVLDWRNRSKRGGDEKDYGNTGEEISIQEDKSLDFSTYRPETALALGAFTDAVIRDYVSYWYSPILPSDRSFPAAAHRTMVYFINSLSSHLSHKRPADSFLDFLTNGSSIIIVFLGELSTALSISADSNIPSDSIDQYLHENPNSNLANILDKSSQQKKLVIVAEDILESFLDAKSWSCDSMRIFLREILANVILETTIERCSKAEWINGLIVSLLEAGEPELMNAIDAGMGVETAAGSADLRETAGVNNSFDNGTVRDLEGKKHKKRVSNAEIAMEEAMKEAKRLSKLIAEEEARRQTEQLASGDGTDFHSPIQGPPSSRNSFDFRRSDAAKGRTSTENGLAEYPHRLSADDLKPKPISGSSSPLKNSANFTTFDQLVPQPKPTALQSVPPSPVPKLEPPVPAKMTLHSANISIFDDSISGDKGNMKTKPSIDYLIQIEPSNSSYPGWMIARKYQDFENLHNIIGRISKISGATAFTEQHSALPHWKGHTKNSFRGELERYIRDALWYRELAESEGMKRFLEKDQGLSQFAPTTKGIPGAIENVGKGVLNVLTSTPKGAADGGKAVLGGITGAFGAVSSLGQKKQQSNPRSNIGQHKNSMSTSSLSLSRSAEVNHTDLIQEAESSLKARESHETQASSSRPASPTKYSLLESQNRSQNSKQFDISPALENLSHSSTGHAYGRSSTDLSTSSQNIDTPNSGSAESLTNLARSLSKVSNDTGNQLPSSATKSSEDVYPPTRISINFEGARSLESVGSPSPSIEHRNPLSTLEKARKKPLTEQETQMAVELLFAVINELYTLSSAWNIRRTLLTAAKTFLLRPGNSNLEAIRVLLQDSMIEANTSDTGIASHIQSLMVKIMPSQEELKRSSKEMTDDEKEQLRIKARKLLVERGMPQALTSVMGSVASGEALGKVFDCLQVEKVARGLIFGLLLQGARAVTH